MTSSPHCPGHFVTTNTRMMKVRACGTASRLFLKNGRCYVGGRRKTVRLVDRVFSVHCVLTKERGWTVCIWQCKLWNL